jgi:hypothetical protein
MFKMAFPDLVEGVRPIGKILKVSHEQVRFLHRKGLIPVTRLGNHHVGNFDALVECERQGRYRNAVAKKEMEEVA